jgi:hypothetical protein
MFGNRTPRHAAERHDEVIDLTERLAPYGEADPAPHWRDALVREDMKRRRRPLRAAPRSSSSTR